ncbi:RBM43 protein, partial [Pitta sordida]|nr:RBM43 protein [Pitta sordida]
QAFCSVTSTLSLAVFKEQFVLEDLVAELKKQSPALSFGALQPDGHLAVQGSFPAIRDLRDLLLLKATSLSEKEQRKDSKSHQKLRRRLQEPRSTTESKNSVEKQEVILDTDVYHYMRHHFPEVFQVMSGVVLSVVTGDDVTTVRVQAAGRAHTAHLLNVLRRIEDQSLKLHETLRKERIYYREQSREERQRYRQACERLKPFYPRVLVIPYDTHLGIIGYPHEVFEFAKKVSR